MEYDIYSSWVWWQPQRAERTNKTLPHKIFKKWEKF
jgi:hypothetical protein